MEIADKIVGNILGKPKKGKDTDGDRVTDKDDCQPKNTMRQDKYGFISNEDGYQKRKAVLNSKL